MHAHVYMFTILRHLYGYPHSRPNTNGKSCNRALVGVEWMQLIDCQLIPFSSEVQPSTCFSGGDRDFIMSDQAIVELSCGWCPGQLESTGAQRGHSEILRRTCRSCIIKVKTNLQALNFTILLQTLRIHACDALVVQKTKVNRSHGITLPQEKQK